jgi:hypothetical protein
VVEGICRYERKINRKEISWIELAGQAQFIPKSEMCLIGGLEVSLRYDIKKMAENRFS